MSGPTFIRVRPALAAWRLTTPVLLVALGALAAACGRNQTDARADSAAPATPNAAGSTLAPGDTGTAASPGMQGEHGGGMESKAAHDAHVRDSAARAGKRPPT